MGFADLTWGHFQGELKSVQLLLLLLTPKLPFFTCFLSFQEISLNFSSFASRNTEFSYTK